MHRWFVAASLPLLIAGCQPPAPQTREQAYCEEMFAIFERHLMPMDWEGNERRDPMADLAVDLCRRNRAHEGIPILEGKLRRARWPLPQH
jgi:hypothetical protein